jgi:hypothetical protein
MHGASCDDNKPTEIISANDRKNGEVRCRIGRSDMEKDIWVADKKCGDWGRRKRLLLYEKAQLASLQRSTLQPNFEDRSRRLSFIVDGFF